MVQIVTDKFKMGVDRKEWGEVFVIRRRDDHKRILHDVFGDADDIGFFAKLPGKIACGCQGGDSGFEKLEVL